MVAGWDDEERWRIQTALDELAQGGERFRELVAKGTPEELLEDGLVAGISVPGGTGARTSDPQLVESAWRGNNANRCIGNRRIPIQEGEPEDASKRIGKRHPTNQRRRQTLVGANDPVRRQWKLTGRAEEHV